MQTVFSTGKKIPKQKIVQLLTSRLKLRLTGTVTRNVDGNEVTMMTMEHFTKEGFLLSRQSYIVVSLLLVDHLSSQSLDIMSTTELEEKIQGLLQTNGWE